MSKTTLKKELQSLNADQLRELILGTYSSRKDFREYFEFFLNPDAEALKEKFRKLIEKEIQRGKYGRSTCRISKLKSIVKDFESFGVGASFVLEMRLYIFEALINRSFYKDYSPTLTKGTLLFAEQTLVFGDKEGLFSEAVKGITDVLNRNFGDKYFIRFLKRNLSCFAE